MSKGFRFNKNVIYDKSVMYKTIDFVDNYHAQIIQQKTNKIKYLSIYLGRTIFWEAHIK